MASVNQWVLDVNLAELEKAIRRYVNELGLEAPKIVRQAFRLVMRDVMSITAPKSLKQGRGAVGRDINRAVYLLDYTKVNVRRLKDAMRKRDVSAVENILRNMKKGRWAKLRIRSFSPTLHTSRRDKRGRVRYPTNVATLDRSQHNRYVRMVRGHVGYTRAGWAPGARISGNKVSQWVSRHIPPGRAKDDTHTTSKNPSMTAIHSAKTTDNLPHSQINSVVRKRAATMHRDVNQVLKGRLSRYFP